MLWDDAGTTWLGYELSRCRVGWMATLIVTSWLETSLMHLSQGDYMAEIQNRSAKPIFFIFFLNTSAYTKTMERVCFTTSDTDSWLVYEFMVFWDKRDSVFMPKVWRKIQASLTTCKNDEGRERVCHIKAKLVWYLPDTRAYMRWRSSQVVQRSRIPKLRAAKGSEDFMKNNSR